MDTVYIILIAVIFSGAGVLMRKNEQQRERIMTTLYLLCGGLALYSVETAERNFPLHLTALVALLLCLVPTIIGSVFMQLKTMNSQKKQRKYCIQTSENFGRGH